VFSVVCSRTVEDTDLTLAELEALPGLGLSRLLTFDLPRVSREEAVCPHGRTQLLVRHYQGTGKSHPNRIRLPRESAASDAYGDVVLTIYVR
jgi:hypothetical protein